MTSGGTPLGRRLAWSKADAWSCLFCACVGLALAVLPHLVNYWEYGSFIYIQDNDDISYLAVARAPFYGEEIRDAYTDPQAGVPTVHSWTQIVPWARFARFFGAPPILLGLVWRISGGCLLGASLYLLFRFLLAGTSNPAAWSLGVSIVCLSDAGFATGRVILQNAIHSLDYLRNAADVFTGNTMAQYRVPTPLLNLPIFLLLVAVLLPAEWTAFNVVAAALLFGYLVHLYFFFWTAAAAALALYASGLMIGGWVNKNERPRLWRRAGLASTIVAAGLAIGSPQILRNYRIFKNPQYQPILQRMSRGLALEKNAPARRMYIRNFWAWLKIGVGASAMLLLKSPRIGLLLCLVLSGYLLANNAIVTGREFENWHWSYVHSTFGEILFLGVTAHILDRVQKPRRPWLGALAVLPLCMLLWAAIARPYEALRAPEAARLSRIHRELATLAPDLAALGAGCTLAGPPAVNIAFLHSRCAQLYQTNQTYHSIIPDRDVHERHALNGWLQGLDGNAYLETVLRDARDSLAFSVPAWREDVVAAERLKIFDELSRDPGPMLDRYHPDVLLLSADRPRPQRGGDWSLIRKNEHWALWRRLGARRPSK